MRHSVRPESAELLTAQLGPHHRARVLEHLRRLPGHDLWLRFGYHATDEALERYVRGLHFTRDAVFGVFDENAQLLALAHLGFDRESSAKTAECGISVLPHARRQRLGLSLLQRCAMAARNRGAMQLMMNYVPENEALKKLAQHAGMQFVPDADEPRAYLNLAPPTAASLMDETFSEMLAAIDLGFRIANAQHMELRATSA